MAYIYQISFTIEHEQMAQLKMGAALEKILGYLRTLLPNQRGYITARAMYSLDIPGKTHLQVQSLWDQWQDLDSHRTSALSEQRILTEFQPHVKIENLTAHIYEEIA